MNQNKTVYKREKRKGNANQRVYYEPQVQFFLIRVLFEQLPRVGRYLRSSVDVILTYHTTY